MNQDESSTETESPDPVRQGCWLGCASLGTLLVILAALGTIYLATHRDLFKSYLASQTREHIETGLSQTLPPDTSPSLIRILSERLEMEMLHGNLSQERIAALNVPEPVQADSVSEQRRQRFRYLILWIETVFDQSYDTERMEDFKRTLEDVDFAQINGEFADDLLQELISILETSPSGAMGEDESESKGEDLKKP